MGQGYISLALGTFYSLSYLLGSLLYNLAFNNDCQLGQVYKEIYPLLLPYEF